MKNFIMSKETEAELPDEDLLTWITTGIDVTNRFIHVNMGVDDTMASLILRGLLKMNSISSEPIDLYLSTFGGDIYDCFAIYDAIRASKSPVRIHASGKIMSAGFVIFLASDDRDAAPNTTFMIHSVSYGSEGKVKDQEVGVVEGKRLNAVILDILLQRTRQTRKFWYRKISGADLFLDVTQAKALGVIPSSKVRTVVKKKVVKKGMRK